MIRKYEAVPNLGATWELRLGSLAATAILLSFSSAIGIPRIATGGVWGSAFIVIYRFLPWE